MAEPVKPEPNSGKTQRLDPLLIYTACISGIGFGFLFWSLSRIGEIALLSNLVPMMMAAATVAVLDPECLPIRHRNPASSREKGVSPEAMVSVHQAKAQVVQRIERKFFVLPRNIGLAMIELIDLAKLRSVARIDLIVPNLDDILLLLENFPGFGKDYWAYVEIERWRDNLKKESPDKIIDEEMAKNLEYNAVRWLNDFRRRLRE